MFGRLKFDDEKENSKSAIRKARRTARRLEKMKRRRKEFEKCMRDQIKKRDTSPEKVQLVCSPMLRNLIKDLIDEKKDISLREDDGNGNGMKN